MAYLHFTLSHSKIQGQGQEHFESEHLSWCDSITLTIAIVVNMFSNGIFTFDLAPS